MQYNQIEQVRKLIYAELDQNDDIFKRHSNALGAAYYTLANKDMVRNYFSNFSNQKRQELIDYRPQFNPTSSSRSYFQRMLLELMINCPNVFNKTINIDDDLLRDFLLYSDSPETTMIGGLNINIGLSKLILKLLNIQPHNIVANFSSDCGILEVVGCQEYPDANFIAHEQPNTLANIISHVRKIFLNNKYQIKENINLFNTPSYIYFDRIFTFAPLGLQAKSIKNNDFMGKIYADHPIYRKSNLAEWFYVLKTLKHLQHNGTAVVLLSNGATWNILDNQIRRDLLRQNVIKAVISLPDKLIKGTSCPMTLLVLQKNSKTISMIDASNIYTANRRNNVLEDSDIDKILSLIDTNTNYSKTVSMSDLQKEDFVLNPIRYTNSQNLKNAVPLKDLLITPINRGKNISANNLDIATTSKHKNYNYLTLSNITNGHIEDNLTAIADINLNTDKYFVDNQDIVISKSGPFKTAVMNKNNPLSKTIASDNIYILKLDQTKVNPYYLKAFFESEEGQKELKRVSSGTNTNILTKEQLENLQIPIIPLAEQDKIANEYKQIEKEIISLKQKLDVLTSALKGIWR